MSPFNIGNKKAPLFSLSATKTKQPPPPFPMNIWNTGRLSGEWM